MESKETFQFISALKIKFIKNINSIMLLFRKTVNLRYAKDL
jgi:hypothetical protein